MRSTLIAARNAVVSTDSGGVIAEEPAAVKSSTPATVSDAADRESTRIIGTAHHTPPGIPRIGRRAAAPRTGREAAQPRRASGGRPRTETRPDAPASGG